MYAQREWHMPSCGEVLSMSLHLVRQLPCPQVLNLPYQSTSLHQTHCYRTNSCRNGRLCRKGEETKDIRKIKNYEEYTRSAALQQYRQQGNLRQCFQDDSQLVPRHFGIAQHVSNDFAQNGGVKGACTGYCYPKIDQDGDKNPPWRNHTLQDIPWGSVLRSGSFLSLIGSVMSPNLRANLWTLLGGCPVRTHVDCSIIPDYPRPF